MNLDRSAALGESTVTPELLRNAGLAGKHDRIKILGDGDLKRAVTIQAHKFSKSAEEKIAKAGGKVEVVV